MADEPMTSEAGTRSAAGVPGPGSAPIHSRYAEQFTTDLASNQARQRELTTELERLRADEAWLRTALASLPGAEAESPAQGAVGEEQAPVEALPRQTRGTGSRKAATATKPAAKKPKKTALPAKRGAKAVKPTKVAPAAEAVPGKTAKKAASKAVPALGESVLAVLRTTASEPRTAREVFQDLGAGEPGRTTSEQSVRNTLEALVKKGQAERSTQGRSVLYTAPAQATAPAGKLAEGKLTEAAETQPAAL
ncbi:BlaI/MecI/CopY family transcriptional regulator [Streptomyces sp. NPDC001941]|uniref:BlaI/MecI/CopY family transcriptional regulator n=1 Tax=Streptomyces sp. NPDC001941 TaxID=3154659 RepID=UPI003333D98F